MDADAVRSWIEGYVRAWTTNDPEDIAGLFTEDARYFTAPFRLPWAGREEIVEGWLGRREEPGTWAFRFDVLAVADGLGFVQGETDYVEPPSYSNLWVVRLEADGRCSEFTEWWMERD